MMVHVSHVGGCLGLPACLPAWMHDVWVCGRACLPGCMMCGCVGVPARLPAWPQGYRMSNVSGPLGFNVTCTGSSHHRGG